MAARDILMSMEQLVDRQHEELYQIRAMIIEQRVSNYPILVFQKPSQTILGMKIIDAAQNTDRWNVYVTHLEELYHKQIIQDEKVEDFQFQYKTNNDKFCILLIEPDETSSFVFVPMRMG